MSNKCASILKLTLCSIMGLVFLVGCGGNEQTHPKITDIILQYDEGRIIVNGSDDVKITGYLLTYSLDEPEIDDESWQESGTFYELKAGNALVWVKDADGNLARSEIIIEDLITLLAKDYEFLAWHLDDSTTKSVDGVSYDLSALKLEYGDLYRFIEPLSKDEVEYRFQYLAEYFAEQYNNGNFDFFIPIDISKVDFDGWSEKIREINEPMYKQELGDEFKMFSKYYRYVEKTQEYYPAGPVTMYDSEKMIDIIDLISFDDKNWFVRDYMFRTDVFLDAYKERGIVPPFTISPLN